MKELKEAAFGAMAMGRLQQSERRQGRACLQIQWYQGSAQAYDLGSCSLLAKIAYLFRPPSSLDKPTLNHPQSKSIVDWRSTFSQF